MKTVCAKEYVDNRCNDEAKKWKNAYNTLRKRSVPAVFDDDEQTLLASNITGGNITLSQPYTNFDFLFILYASEVSISYCILPKYQINRMLDSGSTNWVLINGFAGLFWTIKAKGTTTTFFPTSASDAVAGTAKIKILKIIGIKLKEIT